MKRSMKRISWNTPKVDMTGFQKKLEVVYSTYNWQNWYQYTHIDR